METTTEHASGIPTDLSWSPDYIDLIFFRTDSVLVGVIITDRVQTHKMRILRKLMPNKGVLKHVN